MTFRLDTSGAVDGVMTSYGDPLSIMWGELSPFTQGYIEALFAAHSIERYRSDHDRTYSHGAFDMLAPETLARIIADCEAYLTARSLTADRVAEHGGTFWTWRQSGDLSGFPPLTVQLGDDGKVRFGQ